MKKVLLLLLFSLSAQAGVNHWTQRGPWDPHAFPGETTVLRKGERLYAGSFNAGAFASDDGGATWETLPGRPMAMALDGPNVWMSSWDGLWKDSRVVLPGNIWAIAANGDTVVVSNNVNELQVSHDGGGTWSVTGHNARYTNINDLAIAGNVVYATTWPVQVSLDAGRTWSTTNADAPFSSLLLLPDRVLLGGAGVLRAPIGSATFTVAGAGLPPNTVIEDFAWNGTTVFASVSPREGGGDSLLYASRDRGDTWVLYFRQPGVGRITEIEAEGKKVWIGTNLGVYELTEGVRKQRAVRK
ncbi:MAG TPA: sialidase family protein [Thermoanaerobaculia bacterium]|nr:sialidase family protein [Thermoanaerobaculia bacterium]